MEKILKAIPVDDFQIEIRFEPGQIINKGRRTEHLHDVTLYSPQHPDGLKLSEGQCIRINGVTFPNGGLNNQEVQGNIDHFRYKLNLNNNLGGIKKVTGIRLHTGEEIILERDAYYFNWKSDFSDVQLCNNGGKRKRTTRKLMKRKRTTRKLMKRKRTTHKRKTIRRR
jgi:hypothetical protein